MNFFESLARRSRETGSVLCVGLDPAFERHEVADVPGYLSAIIEATLPYAACYKTNIAFYEQWGIDGLRALEQTLRAIPRSVPVIGDVKRGDMGNTAAAYARAMFEQWDFGAITVNGYQGRDAAEPFLAYEGRGVFILCRTSNPGSVELQEQQLTNGRLVFEQMAVTATAWAPNIGLVVGATAPDELRRVRELVPQTPLLVPGIGAQGGDPQQVIEAAGNAPGTIVVNASRSILYAGEGPRFAEAAAEAARSLRDALAGTPVPT
jgi:orotidine-5'-phosphate decarboxylase